MWDLIVSVPDHCLSFTLPQMQISIGFHKTKHPGVCEAANKTIFRPQLEYASPVWGPYTQSNIYTKSKWFKEEPSAGL